MLTFHKLTTTQPMSITYCFASYPFGNIIIASTDKGICWIGFNQDKNQTMHTLTKMFPHASFKKSNESYYGEIAKKVIKDPTTQSTLQLHVNGTEFQFAVWSSLLNIPFGTLSSYKHIAELIKKPKAIRAVGTAIGRNPIAILVPCHRIISSNGSLGGYFWGLETKQKLLNWEKFNSIS